MCARSASRSLPHYGSPLFGREMESTLLHDLISNPEIRIITITGTAGIGKTRLATSVAKMQIELDTLFIPLAAIADSDLVPSEIGKSLDLQGDDIIPKIRASLEERRGIVLLDNFEQVIQAASAIVEMIPSNPELTVLVTSQRPLQIEGEQVVRLNPLAIPEPDITEEALFAAPSVQLMVQRATEQDSTFSETLQDASASEAIAEICRHLEGIPLALELAASRLSSLSPEVVLAQLEGDQSILSTQRRDTPERQRTMHGAISWSFCLLPAESQRIFLWLGSFTAGFDLEIVDRLARHLQVSERTVDVISELMNLSLIRRVRSGANPWYSMLASIRQFCLAELDAIGEREGAESFVSDYVLDIADRTESTLTGSDSAAWIRMLDQTFPTVRSSVAWALKTSEPRVPMRVAFGMWRYMEKEGRWQELVGWVDQALQWREKLSDRDLISGLLARLTALEDARNLGEALRTADDVGSIIEGADLPDLQVLYLQRIGALEHDQQHLDAAEALFAEAADLAGHHGFTRDAAIANSNLGLLALQRRDMDLAEQRTSHTIALLRELGDTLGVVSALSNLGAVMLHSGDLEKSRIYLEEALETSREMGLTRDMIYILLNYAAMMSELYELSDEDSSLLENVNATLLEAMHHAQQISYPGLEAHATMGLAKVSLIRKDYPQTADYIRRSIDLVSPIDNPRLYPALALVACELLMETGNVRLAAAIVAKSRSYAKETEYAFERQELKRFEALEKDIESQIGDVDIARTTGESWNTEDFVRQLSLAARRAVNSSPAILVKVGKAKAVSNLTPREREILDLLINGESTQSMAEHLSLSPRTITTHIGNIMAKMDVNSRAELVAKALRNQDPSNN